MRWPFVSFVTYEDMEDSLKAKISSMEYMIAEKDRQIERLNKELLPKSPSKKDQAIDDLRLAIQDQLLLAISEGKLDEAEKLQKLWDIHWHEKKNLSFFPTRNNKYQ